MVLDGTGSVYDDTGWYLVSISWYCLLLGGTWSAKGLYACIYCKKWRFGRVTPMPHRQTSEYSATQLVSSIKHKLSHAIWNLFLGPLIKYTFKCVNVSSAHCAHSPCQQVWQPRDCHLPSSVKGANTQWCQPLLAPTVYARDDLW